MDKDIKKILQTEANRIKRLQEIVEKNLESEKEILSKVYNSDEELNLGQRISDKVAKFGGSWAFIISFFLVLLVWIVFNSVVAGTMRFDPYPFILMNLVLSCIAAIQAPIIMMSQNRQEEKDRKRSENDYLVNLKAELELETLHRKLDEIIEEQIKILLESQARQLEILKHLEQKISKMNL